MSVFKNGLKCDLFLLKWNKRKIFSTLYIEEGGIKDMWEGVGHKGKKDMAHETKTW